jgi:hypothetical protein
MFTRCVFKLTVGSGFGAFAPNLSNTERPLSGAVCTSFVIPGYYVDVTSYNDAGSIATMGLKIGSGSTGGVLLATGFDGITGAGTSTGTTASVPTSTRSSGLVGITGVSGSTGTTTSVPTSPHTSTSTSVSVGHAARLRWFVH